MTSQEEQMLNSLVERVNSTQLTEKDPDAATLLERGFAPNPDAVYVLAQSVLVQNIALEQAHTQLTAVQEQARRLQQQLDQQAQQPAHATSFLGNLLGHRDPQPPPLPQQPPYQPVYSPQAEAEYQNPPYGQPYANQPYQGQPYGGPQYIPAASGPPSFLRSAAQTAAGVAAGALAFEGVEALLHGGFGHPGMGYGMGGWGMPGIGMGMGPGLMGGGMGFERPVEETVVNNYYDSPGGGGEHGEHGGHFHESASQQDGQFSDASWSDSQSNFDNNSSFDDSNSTADDNGNFDSGNDGIL